MIVVVVVVVVVVAVVVAVVVVVVVDCPTTITTTMLTAQIAKTAASIIVSAIGGRWAGTVRTADPTATALLVGSAVRTVPASARAVDQLAVANCSMFVQPAFSFMRSAMRRSPSEAISASHFARCGLMKFSNIGGTKSNENIA